MSKDSEALEHLRIAALRRYDVLDTPPEESFDRITRLAKLVLKTPIVLVSLVDEDRQWFKSRQGLEAAETPRDISFCTHAIALGEPLIVRDAFEDPRFRDNPLVVNEPNIRFYMGVPLKTPDGYNIGTLCAIDRQPRTPSDEQIAVLQDLGRMVIDELELRQIATTDSLTGALTRRGFDRESHKERERANRYGSPLCLVSFDLDQFKAINDRHGHAAGDLVLQQVIKACKASLRSVDSIARMGGEEFAILLPHTDQRGGFNAGEGLRQVIAALSMLYDEQPITVTASFGVSVYSPGDEDFHAVLKRADAALYQAKQTGRNRTVCADAGAYGPVRALNPALQAPGGNASTARKKDRLSGTHG